MFLRKSIIPSVVNKPAGIVNNFLFIVISRGIQILSGFVILIAVARYLATDEYGDYAFVITFAASMMSLSYFGIQMVLVREIARDKENASSYIKVAILIRLALCLGALMLAIIAASFMPLSERVQGVIFIAFLSETLLSFSMLMRAIFQGYERMQFEPVLTTIYALVLLGGVGSVIYFDLGFQKLFWAVAFSQTVQLLVAIVIFFTKFPVTAKSFDWGMIQAFLKSVFVIGLGVIIMTNLFRVNVLMLQWLKEAEDVAYFQVVHGLILQIQVLPMALAAAMFPVLSRLVKTDPEQMRLVYEKAFKVLFIASLLISLYLFSFAEEVIVLGFGAKYLPSITVLKILAFSSIFLFLELMVNNVLIAIKMQKYAVLYGGITLVAEIALAFLLIPAFQYHGAAIASLIAYILLFSLSIIFVSKKGFKIPFRKIFVAPSFAAAISLLFIVSIKPFSVILAGIGGIIIYAVILYKMNVITKEELLLLKRHRKPQVN